MKCPFCGASENGVIDSRDTQDGGAIRRRRKCAACDRRFTTYERADEVTLFLIKKDGRRQPYDRNKLIAGLRRACEKRPVSIARIEAAATEIELRARELGEQELSARWFGDQVMDLLRDMDEVAYVRFASVYRSFRDVEEFARELETLRAPSPVAPRA